MKRYFLFVILMLVSAGILAQSNEIGAQGENPDQLYIAATKLFVERKYSQAARLYERVLDLNSTGKNENGESLKPEIVERLIFIYLRKGQENKARALIARFRAASPNNVRLILVEASFAARTGDKSKYFSVMEELVKKDPNNPEWYFNLGVNYGEVGETEKAKRNYKKALEINPNYFDALYNLFALFLQRQRDIVEEMNNLGTSAADSKRYDELKAIRTRVYREALPYLERASKVAPAERDVSVLRSLMDLYATLGMEAEYAATEAKLKRRLRQQ